MTKFRVSRAGENGISKSRPKQWPRIYEFALAPKKLLKTFYYMLKDKYKLFLLQFE